MTYKPTHNLNQLISIIPGVHTSVIHTRYNIYVHSYIQLLFIAAAVYLRRILLYNGNDADIFIVNKPEQTGRNYS